jgi:predicted nuclease of predicted toxin-antitoxin system
VTFLLNMNVPRALASLLAAQGHDARHAGDAGLATASDAAIVEAARGMGAVIITHDLDYGHLLSFGGHSVPSVIIMRLTYPRADAMARAILTAWAEIAEPLANGAIVSIEETRMRVRSLPVR